MKIRFEPHTVSRVRPDWQDLAVAVALVAAVVLLNLFIDAVDRNIERGMLLRQAQRAEVLAGAPLDPRAGAATGRLAQASLNAGSVRPTTR